MRHGFSFEARFFFSGRIILWEQCEYGFTPKCKSQRATAQRNASNVVNGISRYAPARRGVRHAVAAVAGARCQRYMGDRAARPLDRI